MSLLIFPIYIYIFIIVWLRSFHTSQLKTILLCYFDFAGFFAETRDIWRQSGGDDENTSLSVPFPPSSMDSNISDRRVAAVERRYS